MSSELQALGAAAALAAAVLAARCLRGERARLLAGAGFAGLVALASVWAIATSPHHVPEDQVASRPIEVQAGGYVTSSRCRACHPHEYATWHDSYHRTMTRRAEPESVLGDFNDVRLTLEGKQYHLQRDGDEFWVEMDNPIRSIVPGPPKVRERIVMTTGSHQLQAYWFETGFTRTTGLFPFTWQIQEQRWISRRSAFVMPPSDPIDASPGTWTFICLKCHATHARPRVEFEGNTLTRSDTHVAEFGIACESCHGPAANHVEANQSPTRRYAQSMSSEPDPTIVNPAHLAPLRSTEVCGQCHGVFDYFVDERHMRTWFRDGFVYRPGGELGKYRTVKWTGEEQFWSDGLVRTAGREYNAMLGSACHDRGHMTCLSCHVLHQPVGDTRPHRVWADDQLRDLDGDQTCLQCHAKYGADIAAHSHHAAASEGSRCQNCHMPHTTYGLMKGVRTHRIASPTVQSSLATGRPNACNQCHLDQTLAWTATWLHAWYGTEQPTLSTDDRQIAASVRWILAGDAAQRALMAWSLGWAPARAASGSAWMVPYLAELLDDPYEVVRLIAERSLRTLPGFDAFRHDLIGPAEARRAAKAAALSIWQQQGPAIGKDRQQVLFEPDGNLRGDEFARLLRARNLRLVRLFE
jgi:hypothetical protein